MVRGTKNLLTKYALMKLKYDFMGYSFNEVEELSFHHLIVPAKECPALGFGKGYFEWNGALLVKNTAHPYLHLIEHHDLDRFEAIRSEIIDQKIKGHISEENLKAIDDILTSFELEVLNGSKKPKIKEEYTKRLYKH